MLDGHGIAHPRRLGIATHFGILADTPTLGCGKSKLTGAYEEPGAESGGRSDLTDAKTGERIGIVLRSKRRCNPIFISPGHKITLEESLDIAVTCLRGYRIPEPTRLAHNAVNQFRRGEISA
jgi:deoxyribonuclease V